MGGNGTRIIANSGDKSWERDRVVSSDFKVVSPVDTEYLRGYLIVGGLALKFAVHCVYSLGRREKCINVKDQLYFHFSLSTVLNETTCTCSFQRGNSTPPPPHSLSEAHIKENDTSPANESLASELQIEMEVSSLE